MTAVLLAHFAGEIWPASSSPIPCPPAPIAEDESELSMEHGDIISAVETVDKAWFKGCSKDGRQGLFPANYVETI